MPVPAPGPNRPPAAQQTLTFAKCLDPDQPTQFSESIVIRASPSSRGRIRVELTVGPDALAVAGVPQPGKRAARPRGPRSPQ